MKNLTKIGLHILTVFSAYIICTVGLGWFWPIGNCDNAERINEVLINLSYSFVAGLIFYVLVTYLPKLQAKKTITPVIKYKITNLQKQINACIQTFGTNEDEKLVENITKEQLSQLINQADMYSNSFYAKMVGYQQNNLQFLNATRSNVYTIMGQIIDYKEYMSTQQLIDIEKMKDSAFFHLTKVYEDTPTAKLYYTSNEFKEVMINELYDVIIHTRRLVNSFE